MAGNSQRKIKQGKTQGEIYADMGKIGISPHQMMLYQESIKKINAFKERLSDGRNE